MGSEVIIMPIMFLGIFGIIYYYLTTRNKERLALIEAGADAKLFKSASGTNPWYIVLVLGLLGIGVSLGTGLGALMEGIMDRNADGAYVMGIFFGAGLSLIVSFYLIRKLKKEDDK